MKKTLKTPIFFGILVIGAAFLITSCDIVSDIIDGIQTDNNNNNNNNDNNDDNPKPTEDVSTVKTKFNNHYVYKQTNECSVTPSTGDVNILVVPIQFKDKTAFNTNQLNAINASFNGNKENGENDYWESTASFYKKSSYGKLNFNFDICDPYVPSISSSKFESITDDYATETTTLLKELNSNAPTIDGKKVNYSDSRYDSDKDGYIDGVWLIYNEPNKNNVGDYYWAYTSYLDSANSIGKFSTYANCAISFLYDGSSKGYDAHTIIHETGHMMGLDDYYSYELSNNYGYCGGLDMMDLNIGDHNSFSKWCLDWIEPYVVNAKNATVELESLVESGKALVIPTNSFNNSAFSEYLIVDYYTPTSLNELDSSSAYLGYYPRNYLKEGIRVWHVDSRIIEIKAKLLQSGNVTYTPGSYLSPTSSTIPEYKATSNTTATYYTVANSNTPSYNSVDEDFALVELVSKNRSTLYNSRAAANDTDLLHSGDTLKYSTKKGSFNDGTSSNVTIKVDSINNGKATITISR